ncbi:MAG: antitoxin VbhA family protein [Gammaproteobacteria bacterium]
MTKNDREKAFREAEASLRLEGLHPSGSEPYDTIKARIISGEMNSAEGKAVISAYHIEQNKNRNAT